jgi:hypothetical protein
VLAEHASFAGEQFARDALALYEAVARGRGLDPTAGLLRGGAGRCPLERDVPQPVPRDHESLMRECRRIHDHIEG